LWSKYAEKARNQMALQTDNQFYCSCEFKLFL